MISIDVIGQLLPNPITMLVQLCSTLVLFLVIKKYLWKSIVNMLEARSEAMQAELTKATELKDEAEKMNSDAKVTIKEAGNKARELVENAKTESAQLKEKLMKEAKAEADNKLEAARREIDHERNQMREEVAKEIVDVAMAATEKLLLDKTTTEDDRKAIEKFVKDVNA